MTKLIDYLSECCGTVILACFGLLAVTVFLSFYVDKGHAHTWVEQNIPFFWSVFGFVAAVVIIFFARWFGHSGIMTSEDYYDK